VRYCIAGMIVTTKALLDRNPNPADGEIREALAGNLCRCGTHTRILAAGWRPDPTGGGLTTTMRPPDAVYVAV